MPLDPGATAPDFTLRDQHGSPRTLSEQRGRAVMLVFFPFAFSGICTGELAGFRDRLGDVENDRCTLWAASCDPIFTLRAQADRDGLFFPLLSDFWPHGAVASSYDVLDERVGCPGRSSYLIDAGGTIRWSLHSEPGRARDLDAHAAAVRALG